MDKQPSVPLDAFIVTLVLHLSAELDIRVSSIGLRWPGRLLIFARQAHNDPDPLRKSAARAIIDMQEEHMEINVLKAWIMFEPAIRQAAETGCTSSDFHEFILALCRTWHGDTQGVEGLNSTLKNEIRRSPHISLQLLSARSFIKHLLGATGGVKKWTDIEATFEALLALSVNHIKAAKDVLNKEFRWDLTAEPAPSVDSHNLHRFPVPLGPNVKQFQWASAMNLRWYRSLAEGREHGEMIQQCVAFSARPMVGSKVWVACTKIYYISHAVQCTVTADLHIAVDKPLVFKSSVLVLEEYWAAISMGAPVTMPVWTFDIQWKLTPFTAEGVISSPTQAFELSLVEKVKRPVQKRTKREAQPTGPAEDGGEGDPDWVERLAADVNAALADRGGWSGSMTLLSTMKV